MSQVNFFLFADEVLMRLNNLIKTEEVDIFQGRYFDKEFPDSVRDISEITNLSELIFWFRNDTKQPKCRLISNDGIYNGSFSFDYYKDPIIQFSDCNRTPNIISPGRIFYKAGWIEEAQLRKDHEKWARRVSRLFDKDLLKINGFWRISSSVIKWVHNEGCLELGTGGFRINKENLNSLIK